MKSTFHKALAIAAIMIGAAAFNASAQPFTKGGQVIGSKEEAEKVPEDAQVMMACGGCKTIAVVKKGGVLDLFTPSTKHECPGCSGKLAFVGAPGKPGGTKYTHTCSKCGESSAYICAEHRS